MVTDRLAKAPNGVLILDEPFDPVPVAIATDYISTIYVDGEHLGRAPLAVVLDRGSHEVVVEAEKGTQSFTLDANDGAGNDCSPDALFNANVKATLYIHVVGGGTTYDILKVNDATEGAVVV